MRGSNPCPLPAPIVIATCPERKHQDFQHSLVTDPVTDKLHQPLVIQMIEEPSVVRVSSAFLPINVDMWLVVHRELRTNLRIKYVFDFLHHQLGLLLSKSS